MKDKGKIPFICKIKNKLNLLPRSPGASIRCEYGFKHRPINKCRNCPKSLNYKIRRAAEIMVQANYNHIPYID